MKIENSVRPITGVSVNDGQRIDKTSDAAASSSQSQENVHLSKQAQHVGSGAVVDTARVQEIKQAISDGSFKVNPEAVADRLLETARELIQSKKGDA